MASANTMEQAVLRASEAMSRTKIKHNGGGEPVMAPKTAPGKRGVNAGFKVNTNVSGIIAPHIPVFRYQVAVTTFYGDKDQLLTKSCKDDYLKNKRNQRCFDIMEYAFRQFADFFGKRQELVYDLQCILYSLTKLDMGKEKTRVLRITEQEQLQVLGLGDRCTAAVVEVMKVNENFEITLDDFTRVKQDLREMDRSLQQFLEIATSQEAMKNRQRHLTFGATHNFLLNPLGEGFEKNEIPDIGLGKFLAVGAVKNVRFLEGPLGRGNINSAVVVETKKAAFHQSELLHLKAAGILKIDSAEALRKFEVNPIQVFILKSQMKGIYVERENGRNGHQIVDIASTSCSQTTFKMDDGTTISVVDYFAKKGRSLQFPNLPPMIYFRGKDRQYLPMELCKVANYQRVTMQQQTPEQMEKMIRASAVPPAVHQRQNFLNMKALELHDGGAHNATCCDFNIRITRGTLSVPARTLPPPQIMYGQNVINTPNPDGNWQLRGRKPPYIRPAKIEKWAIYGLNTRQDDRFNGQMLERFARMLLDEARNRGLAINDPVECEIIPAMDIKPIASKMQLAEQNGATYVMFVQNDYLKLHRSIKLAEIKCNILTQDVRSSVAMDCVMKSKMQTVENIINKMNIKNGGVNYNIRLESPDANKWLQSDRLIIGLSVNLPPPLLAQEMARNPNAKATVPTVIGFAANTNDTQVEFVGDYIYQEPAITALPELTTRLITARVESRGKPPSHIIIYRGGLSDGQFKMALESEVPAIRRGIKETGIENYMPQLTLIAAQKKNNIVRLFPQEINPQAKASEQNIKSGTVVDVSLVHPYFNEFYLNSHRALQGLTRTPRYSVLLDEAQMDSDQLQIVNLAISLPAPLYTADEYTKRGRNNFTANAAEGGSSGSSGSNGNNGNGNGASVPDPGLNYQKLNDKLTFVKTTMTRQRANA